MSEQNISLDYDAFIRSIKRNKDISHSMLIGAGASISSGIQSAYDCIWEWKKDIFLSKNPNSADYYKNFKNESSGDVVKALFHFVRYLKRLNSVDHSCFQ